MYKRQADAAGRVQEVRYFLDEIEKRADEMCKAERLYLSLIHILLSWLRLSGAVPAFSGWSSRAASEAYT